MKRVLLVVLGVVLVGGICLQAGAAELTAADVASAKGDGPDGKGNTDDDFFGFWFELRQPAGTFMRLSTATATMPDNERRNGIPGKVTGPIGSWLPNAADTDGWIFHTDWDGRGEGVWGDKKASVIMIHPCLHRKTAKGCVAISFAVSSAGEYAMKGRLTDCKLWCCGTGVKWRVEVARGGDRAQAVVAESQPFGDGVGDASVEIDVKNITVKQGQLIRLVIDPGRHYGCDMTKLENLVLTKVK